MILILASALYGFASSRVHVQSAWTHQNKNHYLYLHFVWVILKLKLSQNIFKRNINKNIQLPSKFNSVMSKWRFYWSNNVTLTNQRSFIKKTMMSFLRNGDDRVIPNERRFFLQKIISKCTYSEMTFFSDKSREFTLHHAVQHHKVNQKTKSFVYGWLHSLTMFDVTRFLAFVGASDINSSTLLITIH